MDEGGRILAAELTDNDVADASVFPRLLRRIDGKIVRLTADGAYDRRGHTEVPQLHRESSGFPKLPVSYLSPGFAGQLHRKPARRSLRDQLLVSILVMPRYVSLVDTIRTVMNPSGLEIVTLTPAGMTIPMMSSGVA